VIRYVLHDGARIVHVLPDGITHIHAEAACLGFRVEALPVAPAPGWDAGVGWERADGVWRLPAPAPAPRMLWVNAFLSRFTDAEYTRIKAASEVNAAVARMWDRLFDPRQLRVDLEYPALVEGLDLLEREGLLAPGRAAEIRA